MYNVRCIKKHLSSNSSSIQNSVTTLGKVKNRGIKQSEKQSTKIKETTGKILSKKSSFIVFKIRNILFTDPIFIAEDKEPKKKKRYLFSFYDRKIVCDTPP